MADRRSARKNSAVCLAVPVARVIGDERLLEAFPGRTVSDLYVWIVKHWDFLKKKFGVHYPIIDAARDFTSKYGKEPANLFRRVAGFFKSPFGGRG